MDDPICPECNVAHARVYRCRAGNVRIFELEKRLAEAEAALERYGVHEPTCPVWQDNAAGCACGLSGSIAKWREAHDWKPVTGAHGIEGYGEKEDPDGL